jgi:hypothetical protein
MKFPPMFRNRHVLQKRGLNNGLKKSRGLMDRIKENGFTQNDIPKAIIFHEFLGIFMLALTWSLCYFYPPSQNHYLQQPIMKMKSMIPERFSSAVASNGFLSSKIGSAYVESSCVRKIIRPLTMPSKVFLTIQFLKMTRPNKLLQPLPLQSTSVCSGEEATNIAVIPNIVPFTSGSKSIL